MDIKSDYNLKNFNTFKLDSVARYFFELNSDSDLLKLSAYAKKNNHPLRFLGGGSNLVLPARMDALVIKNDLKGITLVEETGSAFKVSCASGENWHMFVMSCLQKGYHGLENLALIPGTVGGAPIQNIGAYGVEVNRFITKVTAYDFETDTYRSLSNSECLFEYRNSIFKTPNYKNVFITSVEFEFPKNHVPNISYAELATTFKEQSPTALEVANKVIEIRQKKLPDVAVIPNVGSFFKNPIVSVETLNRLKLETPDLVSYPQGNDLYKLAAGQLIEKLGYKGKKESTVGMYDKQALVMVNLGHGRIEDIQTLVSKISMDSLTTFGVRLEVEPIFW